MKAKKKKKKVKSDVLTDKQKVFCKEYILDWNATRAAKAAGYSEDTSRQIGSENLSKLYIKSYIDYLKNNLAEVAGISPLSQLNEYKKIAYSSIAHMHLSWVERKELESLTKDQKDCIQEIETRVVKRVKKEYNEETEKFEPVEFEVEQIRIKLYDKLRGLESINKMLGWDAPKKINVDGKLSILDLFDDEEEKEKE